jgi:hypothetical protein
MVAQGPGGDAESAPAPTRAAAAAVLLVDDGDKLDG